MRRTLTSLLTGWAGFRPLAARENAGPVELRARSSLGPAFAK